MEINILNKQFIQMNSSRFYKLILVFLVLVFNQSVRSQNVAADTITVKSGSSYYTGSYLNGNYVWGGAMNLAWNELCANLIKDKLKVGTTDPIALTMADRFNNSLFTKDDLDLNSYYIKSGFGQKTVDAINKETRKKFPSKSFAALTGDFKDQDMIAYAYFSKQVFYPLPFTKTETTFEGEKVAGFYAWKHEERENIRIIQYVSDERFIVSLKLKDDSDQLILAKGFDMGNPEMVVAEIDRNIDKYPDYMESMDNFEAPKLNLDFHRDYNELIGKQLANDGFGNYKIGQMFENIKFTMDEKGAKVENEGAIVPVAVSFDPNAPRPRRFELNKPFWVVMKRKGSKNPYFILGINNTALMEKVKM